MTRTSTRTTTMARPFGTKPDVRHETRRPPNLALSPGEVNGYDRDPFSVEAASADPVTNNTPWGGTHETVLRISDHQTVVTFGSGLLYILDTVEDGRLYIGPRLGLLRVSNDFGSETNLTAAGVLGLRMRL